MVTNGFIDVLFLVLFATMVMLSESLPLKGLDVAPARSGSGAVSPLAYDAARLVVVGDDDYAVSGDRLTDLTSVAGHLDSDTQPVLVPESGSTSHHRMIEAWTRLNEMGWSPVFGVRAD